MGMARRLYYRVFSDAFPGFFPLPEKIFNTKYTKATQRKNLLQLFPLGILGAFVLNFFRIA
jgi:hypothetical protein